MLTRSTLVIVFAFSSLFATLPIFLSYISWISYYIFIITWYFIHNRLAPEPLYLISLNITIVGMFLGRLLRLLLNPRFKQILIQVFRRRHPLVIAVICTKQQQPAGHMP